MKTVMENMSNEVQRGQRLFATTARLTVTSQRPAEGFDQGCPQHSLDKGPDFPGFYIERSCSEDQGSEVKAVTDKVWIFHAGLGVNRHVEAASWHSIWDSLLLDVRTRTMSLTHSLGRRGLML